MNPNDLLYAETHEWVRVIPEGGRKIGTVGITAFALEQQTGVIVRRVASKLRERLTHGRGARLENVRRHRWHRSNIGQTAPVRRSDFGQSRAFLTNPAADSSGIPSRGRPGAMTPPVLF